MACNPEVLRDVPLLALLDEDERSVLASEIELKTFAPGERIYAMGDLAPQAYVLLSGKVQVSTIDQDQQEVVVEQPGQRDFFGFASMLQQTPHQTSAHALEECTCLEVSRDDIGILLQRKPQAGMDLLTTLSRQLHAAHNLVRSRASRNPNDVIEERTTPGERIADSVARFGGSWIFIILFSVILIVYTTINVILGKKAWDPYPFILLNLFLSRLAAFQAPLIMMSQNRQDAKDRVRSELDFEVNRRAEAGIRVLIQKFNLLDENFDDLKALVHTAKSQRIT
jgi:uncharacterized membrane protein